MSNTTLSSAVTTYRWPIIATWAASLVSLAYLQRKRLTQRRNRAVSLAIPSLTRAPSVPRAVTAPSAISFPDDVLNEAYRLMLSNGHAVYLIRAADECDVLMAQLLKAEDDEDAKAGIMPGTQIRVIGFDCEWRPGDKQKKKEEKKDDDDKKDGITTDKPKKETKVPAKKKEVVNGEAKTEAKTAKPKQAHALVDEHSTRKRSAVALLQITMRHATLLVHLAVIGFVPQSIVSLLEDTRVYKSGVGCTEDATYLFRDYSVHVKGTIELAAVAARTSMQIGGISLRALASDVLAVQLDKDFRIRCGNWDSADLSPAQLIYAAADAYYSRAIFIGLYNMVAAASATIPTVRGTNILPQLFDEPIPGKSSAAAAAAKKAAAAASTLTWADVPTWCNGLVEAKAPKPSNNGAKNKNPNSKKADKNGGHAVRATPLYQNCVMLSPDDTFLCTCDQWKIQWYLDRKLGVIIKEDPLTIKLNFKPAGAGNAGNKFYEETKSNICVVCGTTEELLRHNVIPLLYRRHFPVRIKSHSSHDVVLLCAPCHTRADQENDKLRRILKVEVPLDPEVASRETIDLQLKPVVAAGSALQRNKDRLPAERREELFDILRVYYGHHDITDEDIQNAAVLKFRKAAVDKRDLHGATVTRQLCSTATELAAFTRRWRQWFLDSMKPQHLSKHWDVNHSKPNDDTEENFNDGNGDGDDENEDEEKKRSKSSGRVKDSSGRNTGKNSGRRAVFADKIPAVGNPDWKPTEHKDVSKMTPDELTAAGLTSYGAPMGSVSSPAVATAAVPIVTSAPAAATTPTPTSTSTVAAPVASPTSSVSSSRSRNSNDDDDDTNNRDDGDEDDTSPAPEASPSSSRNGNDNDDDNDDENDEEITPASVQPALED